MMNAVMKMRALCRLITGISLTVGTFVLTPTTVRAAAVVGSGNPASCTEKALSQSIASGGTVTFNCGTAPVTISIKSPMKISKSTTIDGSNLVTLDGAGKSYFFYVDNYKGVSFTVKNLTFANGQADGEGGAIHAHFNSILTVDHCTFTNNVTTSNKHQFDGGGGAIFVGSEASATITNSAFINNSGANGGAIWSDTGTITIANSVFSNNSATYQGGAIAVSPDNVHPTGHFTVSNSTFT